MESIKTRDAKKSVHPYRFANVEHAEPPAVRPPNERRKLLLCHKLCDSHRSAIHCALLVFTTSAESVPCLFHDQTHELVASTFTQATRQEGANVKAGSGSRPRLRTEGRNSLPNKLAKVVEPRVLQYAEDHGAILGQITLVHLLGMLLL
jgi:hypothetical protein